VEVEGAAAAVLVVAQAEALPVAHPREALSGLPARALQALGPSASIAFHKALRMLPD